MKSMYRVVINYLNGNIWIYNKYSILWYQNLEVGNEYPASESRQILFRVITICWLFLKGDSKVITIGSRDAFAQIVTYSIILIIVFQLFQVDSFWKTWYGKFYVAHFDINDDFVAQWTAQCTMERCSRI